MTELIQGKKKRRDKIAGEFGASLMSYLGKKADRVTMDYSNFQQCLRMKMEGVVEIKNDNLLLVMYVYLNLSLK